MSEAVNKCSSSRPVLRTVCLCQTLYEVVHAFSHNKPVRKVLSTSAPFYTGQHGGSEGFSNLPKVTELIMAEPDPNPDMSDFSKGLCFYNCPELLRLTRGPIPNRYLETRKVGIWL